MIDSKRYCWRLVLIMLIGLVFFPVGAFSQSQTATKDEAKQHFFKGKEYVEKGDYANAIVEFKNSYELKPATVSLYNIGICYKYLGKNALAIKYLKMYLSKSGNEIDEKEREKVSSMISDLQKLVGKIVVSVAEIDAKIKVDGELIGLGPLAELEADPGVHKVAVSKEGFVSWEGETKVEAGKEGKVEAKLQPMEKPSSKAAAAGEEGKKAVESGLSSLTVECPQEGAQVFLDGRSLGGTPQKVDVAQGTYRISVMSSGYQPWEKEIEIGQGDRIVFEVNLLKEEWAVKGSEKKGKKKPMWLLWAAIGIIVGGGIATAIAVPTSRTGSIEKGTLATKFPE
jgi:hypothetical protein